MRTLISKFTGRVPIVIVAVCLFQVIIASAVSGASIDIVKASHQLNSGPVLKTGMNAEFLLRFTNDSGQKLNCSHAWKLSSPDGCVWDSSTIMEVGTWPSGPFPFKDLFDIEFTTSKCGTGGTGVDTLYLIAVGSDSDPSKQMPDGWNDSGIVVTAWFHERSQGGKHICIDSCSCPPSAIWKWSAAGVSPDVVPEFKGIAGQPYTPGYGYCFELRDECPLAPVVLNTGGMVSEPYVDPNLQGNVCTTLSYDFDSYDACYPVPQPEIHQISGPGATDPASGIWVWNSIPLSAAGQSYTVTVRAGYDGSPVDMTVNINQQALHISPGYSAITLKTGEMYSRQINVEPSGCGQLSWSSRQFAGDPSGVFSVDQSGVTNFSATLPGLYTYVVTASSGVVADSCDPSYVVHGANCCAGQTGNLNVIGIVDLSDLSLLVAYLTTSYVPLSCYDEANVNGLGIVDLSDLSMLVNYLTGSGIVLPSCP